MLFRSAGNPEDLSVKSAFPKLFALEEEYGGLIMGTFRSIRKRKKRKEQSKQSAKMLSFKDGMQVLPEAIKIFLDEKVKLSASVESVQKTREGKYGVAYSQNDKHFTLLADVVLSTAPAYKAAELFGSFDVKLNRHLNEVYYPPVLVVYLAYRKEDVGQPLDGFGFLIPPKENKKILGILFSSSIFPERAPKGYKLIRIIMGGDMGRWIVNKNREELIKIAYDEAKDILKFSGNPYLTEFFMYEKAIPQYYIGHSEKVKEIENILNKNIGLYIGGNTLYGIGINDCTHQSFNIADKIFL